MMPIMPEDVVKEAANRKAKRPERYAISYVPSKLRGTDKAGAKRLENPDKLTKYITNPRMIANIDRYIALLAPRTGQEKGRDSFFRNWNEKSKRYIQASGKSMVADAAKAICKIVNIKQAKGKKFTGHSANASRLRAICLQRKAWKLTWSKALWDTNTLQPQKSMCRTARSRA